MSKKHNVIPPSAVLKLFTRRHLLLILGAVAIAGSSALALTSSPPEADKVIVYKDPSCECCDRWARHMLQNGFSVVVNSVDDITPVKRKLGVPQAMEACHTASVGGYVIEGHVPADDIKRMLIQRPDITGLAVPGMPARSPGMDSPGGEPFSVMAFDAKGMARVFASY